MLNNKKNIHPLRLGISTCLLGENVRYDGGHKHDRYLTDILGPYVEWVSVCPEVECGLPIPREAMRLVGEPENPRLMTQKTKINHTDRMLKWAEKKLDVLDSKQLCGYIFKSKSPSSGMRDVKVYNEKGFPAKKGVGLFARAFMDRFSLLPVEDEGRLHDAGLRENFIERVFVMHRWQQFKLNDNAARGLLQFHQNHKLLMMAHSAKHLSLLGKIVGNTKQDSLQNLSDQYISILMDGLKLKATVKKNVNVLQHVMGYFKKLLSKDEKQELLEVIEHYHQSLVPLIVPITLLQHYVRKYDESYLNKQIYLNPHPAELMLRNHV